LDRVDKLKLQTTEARNGLESFVYDTKDKLWMESVQNASTLEERGQLEEQLVAVGEWLYEEEGGNSDLLTYTTFDIS